MCWRSGSGKGSTMADRDWRKFIAWGARLFVWPFAAAVATVAMIIANDGSVFGELFQVEVALWTIVFAGCMGAFQQKGLQI